MRFDWDEANRSHIARHHVEPSEAEEVIDNDPLDFGMELVDGEDRYVSLGPTNAGRLLVVITTWREDRIRVITAFGAIKRLAHLYYQEKGGKGYV